MEIVNSILILFLVLMSIYCIYAISKIKEKSKDDIEQLHERQNAWQRFWAEEFLKVVKAEVKIAAEENEEGTD